MRAQCSDRDAQRYCPPVLADFFALREAASSAEAPASRANPVTYDSVREHMTVTSQHKDLPLCHGTSVRSSGVFPSVRNNPVCSFGTGFRLRQSFERPWRGSLSTCPGLFCQQNCEAHERQLVNRIGTDVECRDL